MAAKFEISAQGAGTFNWVLKSQGRTLATGESYTRKVSAEKAIESLRKAALGATVSDLTVKAKPAAAKRPAKAAKAAPARRAAKADRGTKAATPVAAAKAVGKRTGGAGKRSSR
jgi:uncharacterized protein YegP (UPF0339 family)